MEKERFVFRCEVMWDYVNDRGEGRLSVRRLVRVGDCLNVGIEEV